jgi:hypothetical protein
MGKCKRPFVEERWTSVKIVTYNRNEKLLNGDLRKYQKQGQTICYANKTCSKCTGQGSYECKQGSE